MEETTGTNRFRIIYLIARFHPFKGGAEQNCYQLAVRMAAAGHDVTVFTSDASPDGFKQPAEETIEGIKVRRFHNLTGELSLGFYPEMLPAILSTPADIIHVENGPGFIWHEFCLWAKKIKSPKTKFIVTPHGPFMATPTTHSGFRYWFAMIGRIVTWPYFRIFWTNLFNVFIQVNPKQELWLKRIYGVRSEKIRLLPNGIPADIIEPSKPDIPTDPLLLTYLGRLEKYKGIQDILQAVQKLKLEKGLNADYLKLTIMGKGIYLSTLRLLRTSLGIEDQVEILENPDNFTRDNILLNKSHVHILASEWEATGIVLIEAMAKGNVVLTTTGNEAATMLIEQGQNGYIFEPHDVSMLAEHIYQLASNPELRQKMIDLNLEKAKLFTWENIFPDYLKILTEL